MVTLTRINCYLLCISLFSINLPVKVYPIVFLFTSISFLIQCRTADLRAWAGYLFLYSLYATCAFLITAEFDPLRVTNFYKILINFFFLYSAITWLKERQTDDLAKMVDYTLHITFFLIAMQLLVYHSAQGFQIIFGSESSNEGSSLYDSSLFFFGLDDKNLFGARIATLGFPYILLGLMKRNRISLIRVLLILFLAFISMSRTPILAVFVGVILLVWHIPNKWMKASVVVTIVLSLPFILEKALRIDKIRDADDGMGVRLMYWISFFENSDKISIFGNGFQAASEFLPKYSPIYLGEPNIHNTFLNNYLDFGIFGLGFYLLFLFYFYKFCYERFTNNLFWIVGFAPLLTVMMLLFPGYDNDIVIYLMLIFLIGNTQMFNKKELSYGL